MKERLGMAAGQRQEQRGDGEPQPVTPAGGQPPKPQEKERKAGDRRTDAPTAEEENVGREAPSDRPCERRQRAQTEIEEKEEAGEEREKDRERAGERP